MPRTLSVSHRNNQNDLDGLIIDGIESLRQRVHQAVLLEARTWFLDLPRGVDYALVRGHRTTTDLATAELNRAIREEGGVEVERIYNVQTTYDFDDRVFTYASRIDTIYGEIDLEFTLT